MAVYNQPRDLIRLIGNDSLGKKGLQRQVGQNEACGYAMFCALRGEACEFVA